MKTEKIMQQLTGKTYKEIVQALSIEQGDGDCCGYADVDIIDAVKDLNNADNAILLHVVKIDYNVLPDPSLMIKLNPYIKRKDRG